MNWWDSTPEELVELLPLLCNEDLNEVRKEIKKYYLIGIKNIDQLLYNELVIIILGYNRFLFY